MDGDRFWMTSEDRKRLFVIKQALDKKVTQRQASELLKLSVRQIKRLCKRVKTQGDMGIIHGNRGQHSNRCIAQSIKEKTIRVCQEQYVGFGPSLVSEMLLKNEQIRISPETARRWLLEAKIEYRRRKQRAHRRWRAPKEHFGEMVQIDGSHHDWLEGRGPRLVLMGFIDDATSQVFARFYEYEGTFPAFDGLSRYIRNYGIPCSIYLDKHSTYKGLRKITLPDQLEGDAGQSHFQRGTKELGIELIHANSPQAKGRIERFFRTAQDRLVKMMRIAGVCTLAQANRFLSSYLVAHNRKFSRNPARAGNLHRPVPAHVLLESVLSVQTKRFLRNDFTVSHGKKLYQVETPIRTRYVTVQERVDGTIHIMHRDKELKFKIISRRSAAPQTLPRVKKLPKKPDLHHPWKKWTGDPEKSFLVQGEGDISIMVKR